MRTRINLHIQKYMLKLIVRQGRDLWSHASQCVLGFGQKVREKKLITKWPKEIFAFVAFCIKKYKRSTQPQ